jgi:hypothetical protein
MNPHIKTFVASGAIGHRRFVKFTANDGEVALATAATDKIAGVTDFPSGAASGERIDVVMFGPAEVVAGGAITPGALITAGAAGVAVAAAPSAGTSVTTGGFSMVGAASGDFVPVFVQRGALTQPAA